MFCELPEFQRCCFCLPLRFGLIAWGYIKLIIDTVTIAVESYLLYDSLSRLFHIQDRFAIYGNQYSRYCIAGIIFESIMVFVFVTDFVVTTVYVYGGHTKNLKLLKMFYYYSHVTWIIVALLVVVAVGSSISEILYGYDYYPEVLPWKWLFVNLPLYFLSIVGQTYILLLLRSEIIKLSNNCEFRFVNKMVGAECTLIRKDDITNGENRIQAA